ncbi:hypothetical protein PG985_003723 [Apiospora marii]|uniref:F-box domain-containing protein n=1 Tax=Apiospora marii TaxID=335849 RepID=A0ABR1SH90_9PEZI
MAGTSATGPPAPLRRSTRSTSKNNDLSQTSRVSTAMGSKRARQSSPAQDATDQPAQPKRRKKETPSYLCRSDNEIASDPNRLTFLGKLPPEILMEVANASPITAAVCLMLTCKLALASLGTQWWTRYLELVKSGQRDQTIYANHVSFLESLCRDIRYPNYNFCVRCTALHTDLKPPAEHVKTRLTQSCQGHSIDYLPRGLNGGYNLLLAHISNAFNHTLLDARGRRCLDYLAGNYQMSNANLRCTINTTAAWVKGNLILRHKYIFTAATGSCLDSGDILNLPLRLCPHQSTSRQEPPPSRYLPDKQRNGPLLTKSILPPSSTGLYSPQEFRKPTTLEQKQLVSASGDDTFLFKCQKCPTKWRVAHGYLDAEKKKPKELQKIKLSSFHCFGSSYNKAYTYFPRLVRREGVNLGTGRRNDEWWSEGKTVPDFKVE